MATNYTTNTASLKTSIADIHKLDAKIIDAKKIKLNGENLEDLLSSAGSNIIIEDGREVKSKYDIWEHAAVENEDGSVTVKNLYVPDASKWYEDHEADFLKEEKEGAASAPWGEMNARYCVKSRSVIGNKLYNANTQEVIGSIDTSKIIIGDYLFMTRYGGTHWATKDYFPADITFSSNLNNLKSGRYMFAFSEEMGESSNVALDFTADLSNLVDGTNMFENIGFINFRKNENGDEITFDNLEIGDNMFEANVYLYNNSNIPDYLFKTKYPKLRLGNGMFVRVNPIGGIFSAELPSLEEGRGMFETLSNGVPAFDEFHSDLPKLKDGSFMLPCEYKFRGSLPSLKNGVYMFDNNYNKVVRLDAESIIHIVDSIPDRTGLENISDDTDYSKNEGYIDIGVGCSDTEEDKQLYAEEGGWNSFQEILDEFDAKNWVVRFSFNGRPTTTYGMRNIEPVQETPMWCKLEEVIMPSDKNLARRTRYAYTSEDGTKFYNIHSYHVSNRENENYIQFNSLEDAITHWNLKEKE